MKGVLNAAIAGLVIATGGCEISYTDGSVKKTEPMSECAKLDMLLAEIQERKDQEEALNNAFGIIDEKKRQMIVALGGTQEGLNEPDNNSQTVGLFPDSISILEKKRGPFAIACEARTGEGAWNGRDYSTSRGALKVARSMVAPGMGNDESLFYDSIERESTEHGVVACVRSELKDNFTEGGLSIIDKVWVDSCVDTNNLRPWEEK